MSLPLWQRAQPRFSPSAPSAPGSWSSPHKLPQISWDSAETQKWSITRTELQNINQSSRFTTDTHLPGFHNYRGQDFFPRVSQKYPSRYLLENDLKRAAIHYTAWLGACWKLFDRWIKWIGENVIVPDKPGGCSVAWRGNQCLRGIQASRFLIKEREK